MTEKLPGTVTRIYYAVPGHYGIGPEFEATPEGHKAAIAYARSTIKRFDYFGGEGRGGTTTYSRAFVDKRWVVKWADGSGVDRSVDRVEIFLTDDEKRALAPEVRL